MKILVTATNYSKYCLAGKRILLKAGCQIFENPHGRPYTLEELKDLVGDIDGVVAGVDEWDENVFKFAPKLKILARFGVGIDNINIEDAKKYNIAVCNCPGINTSAVAEQAVAMMLCLTRDIPNLNTQVKQGKWPRIMTHEMKSRTVGLLGFGAIARNVALKLQGFGPSIIAYDKFPDMEAAGNLGVKMTNLDEVLKSSDILSIHLPALSDTKGMLCNETIDKMKDGILIVNTARGSLVKEEDIVKALKTGKIGGYATDVYENEPVSRDNPLFSAERCIFTPHTSAETYENCERTSVETAKMILDFMSGKDIRNRIC